MNVELVIARYNEDLSWLNKVKNKKITIYNKGESIKEKYIKLDNIGRESHTYLYHIINNYDNLSDITIFSQGDPFFHSPKFIDLIKDPLLFEPIQPLTAHYSPSANNPNITNNNRDYIMKIDLPKDGHPPKQIFNKANNLSINNIPIYVEYYNKDGVVLYPGYYNDFFIMNFIKNLKYIFKFTSIVKFMKDRYKLNNINTTTLIPMSYAGIFSVHKFVILKRKKEFYINIFNLLLEDQQKHDFDSGLLLERLWLSIFYYQKYNKNYIEMKSKDFSIKYTEIPIYNNSVLFFVKTFNTIVIEIKINNIDIYNIIIGLDKIYISKNNKPIKKINLKNKIFLKQIFYKINFKLKNHLDIFIENNFVGNVFISNEHNTINYAKIEKNVFNPEIKFFEKK